MKNDPVTKWLFEGRLALAHGATEKAEKLFSKVIVKDPGRVEGWLGLGRAQHGQQRLGEAIMSFTSVVRLLPNAAEGWLHLGFALMDSGQPSEARDAFFKAYSIAPNMAEICRGLGSLCVANGDDGGAIDWFNRAVALRDTDATAWHQLAMVWLREGKIERAAACIERALQEEPTNVTFLVVLAEVYLGFGRIAKARTTLEKALKLNPANGKVRSVLLMLMGYLPEVSPAELLKRSCEWDYYHAYGVQQTKRVLDNFENDGRLKIGYVSADFYTHSVGLLFNAVLLNHDRNSFDIVCYSCGDRYDTTTESIRTNCTVWREINGLTDAEAAELIAKDNLDLLVDLAGHSGANRLGIFARKPARIQISWLGYAHTTGLRTMDWFVADSISVPDGEERYFAEKVLRMPHFRLCFTPPSPSAEVVPLPCIDNGYITFGSFNNVAKLNEDVVKAWATILLATPGSRLMLKWKTMESRSVRERYKRLFARYGITRERLDFREGSSLYLMLLEYGEVDIALDPFPFSGGLTTFQALWMGVPVISLPMQTPISRQTAAILHDAGLCHLVAGSVDEYIAKAVSLATDRKQLGELRSSIRSMLSSSPIADLPQFTRNLENLYRYALDHDSKLEGLPTPSMDALEKVARECYENGQTDRAAEILDRLGPYEQMSIQFKTLAAMIAFDQGKRQKAVNMLYQLAGISADTSVLLRLGTFLKNMNRFHESNLAFDRSLTEDPNFAPAHYFLAGNLVETGMVDEGIKHLEQSLKLSKYSLGSIAGYLFSINYSEHFSPQELFDIHRRYAAEITGKVGRIYQRWNNSIDPDRKIKIGFVSGDLGMHPVSFFLVRSFQYHDRSAYDYYCYSSRAKDDDFSCYFRDNSHAWRSIRGVGTKEVAEIIRRDGIDILVDLSGYTRDSRLDVFALKPAPVQISCIGYPNTTGLESMDYRITDAVADPPGAADLLHSEKLVRLPGTFLCYYPPPEAPAKLTCPCRKNGYITFGSFNNLSKITPRVVELWAMILHQVPTAKLFMKRDAFSDSEVCRYFEQCFAQHGINADRLMLLPASGDSLKRVDIHRHIAFYQDVDIALDSFPYNGTTTTCEALWMGVPVVALRGDRHAARVGASILTEIGLSDLIAETAQEYVAKAVELAGDDQRREYLRKKLRDMMSNSLLGDGVAFTRNLENAYRTIWREWCEQNQHKEHS